MTGTRPAEILRQLGPSGEPDAALVAHFAATKDAAAFAELVRRHGPLVFGVCRRVTGHSQDAEDAFQATFLVLAKKAGSLRNPALLGNWLYGVAYRVAWRAKRSALRRKRREVAVSALPEVSAPSQPPAPELGPILDEEVAALPAHYRDAIVLCDLRGISREEAAAALGIPEGTLSSRLANGRKRLAARLTKRGVALAAATLPAAISEAATAAVPNELLTKTCGLVADWSAGGTVPGPLARLAHGGYSMRKAFLLVAVMGLVAGGAVLAARSTDDPPPSDPPKPKVVAQKPEPVLQPKDDALKNTEFTIQPSLRSALDAKLSTRSLMWNETGTHLALKGREALSVEPKQQDVVHLIDVRANASTLVCRPSWRATLDYVSPGGTYIVTELREDGLISGRHELQFWKKDERPGALRGTMFVDSIIKLGPRVGRGYFPAEDDKTFRTITVVGEENDRPTAVEVLEADAATGKVTKILLRTDYAEHALSPNGKRFAALSKTADKVIIYDVDTGKRLGEFVFPPDKVVVTQPDRERNAVVFSPDGDRLVASRGVGQTHVVNALTGKAISELEGASNAWILPNPFAFGAGGKLLVAFRQQRRVTTGVRNGQAATWWEIGGQTLCVWDTRTGKLLKSWRWHNATVAFCPTRPLLAIAEENGTWNTRLGLWDFSAEVPKK